MINVFVIRDIRGWPTMTIPPQLYRSIANQWHCYRSQRWLSERTRVQGWPRSNLAVWTRQTRDSARTRDTPVVWAVSSNVKNHPILKQSICRNKREKKREKNSSTAREDRDVILIEYYVFLMLDKTIVSHIPITKWRIPSSCRRRGIDQRWTRHEAARGIYAIYETGKRNREGDDACRRQERAVRRFPRPTARPWPTQER